MNIGRLWLGVATTEGSIGFGAAFYPSQTQLTIMLHWVGFVPFIDIKIIKDLRDNG